MDKQILKTIKYFQESDKVTNITTMLVKMSIITKLKTDTISTTPLLKEMQESLSLLSDGKSIARSVGSSARTPWRSTYLIHIVDPEYSSNTLNHIWNFRRLNQRR